VSRGDWAALETLIGRTPSAMFMYMGRSSPISHHGGWVELYLSKHIKTGRYLNVAEDGTWFRCAVEGYAVVTRGSRTHFVDASRVKRRVILTRGEK
jgi:hypothetical protein